MNILEQAACLGLQTNAIINSTPITYRRANRTMEIPDAQKAQKAHKVNTNEVFGLTLVPHDWIVPASHFDHFGLPEIGDEIRDSTARHRVCQNDNGEPCWRYHVGTGKQFIRIHTEIVE